MIIDCPYVPGDKPAFGKQAKKSSKSGKVHAQRPQPRTPFVIRYPRVPITMTG